MKVLAVLGPLGSGKTTMVNRILRLFQHLRTLVVVNDVGTENIDARRLQNAGDVKALTAGCIGCSDLPAFLKVIEEAKAVQGLDLLIIEPTGIADGKEVRDAVVGVECEFRALTLVDVRHFERNRALGCMEGQLAVANAVALTWVEDDFSMEVLEYVGRHAPGTAIVKVETDELLEAAIQEVLSAKTTVFEFHICNLGCGHDHGSGHHHRHGDHGVFSFSLQLREETSYADLVSTLAPHLASLVRAKGVVAGHEFDFVQGDIHVSEASVDSPHGNFIFNRKVEEEVLAGISKMRWEDTRTKKDRMRDAGVSLEATLSAIEWQLGQYPPVVAPTEVVRVDCEADVVYQLTKREGVPQDIQRDVMTKYLSWRLLGATQIQSGSWENHLDLSYWKRRLGVNLGYMPVAYPRLVSEEILRQIIVARPAHMLVEGLFGLTELSFDEEKAEEEPETVAQVVKFGIKNESLDLELARSAVDHCLELAEKNPAWHRRWKQILSSF